MPQRDASTPAFPAWLFPVVFLLAIVSSYSMYKRYEVEAQNKAVNIAAEYDTVASLARSQGLSADDGIGELKKEGLNAVILGEDNLSELLSNQQITLVSGTILAGDSQLLDRVLDGLKRKFPLDFKRDARGIILPKGLNLGNIRSTGVGLDPEAVVSTTKHGLRLIVRYGNPEGTTAAAIKATLHEAKKAGATVFLPQGDQVLGRRDALDATVEALKEEGIYYATPEFSKIGGDANIVEKEPGIVIRLHAAQVAELDKLPTSEAVDRYVKAARERNQRILLVRPISVAAAKPLASFGEFIKGIREGIEEVGYSGKDAHPFTAPSVNRFVFPAIGVLSALVAAFVFSTVFPSLPFAPLVLAFGLVGVGCYSPSLRPLMALIGALSTPVLAFIWLQEKATRFVWLNFIILCAITWVGGFAAAGLLNDLPYFIQAKQFLGVKAAVFLPVLIVGWFLLSKLGDWRNAVQSPLSWQQLGVAFLVLAALGMLVARTGNDNPASVSGTELKMRALLDNILIVRPRTKEFLLGHPALIIGLAMYARVRAGTATKAFTGWTVVVLMVGAIGQTGLLNTMCHTHTPLVLSLLRNFVGAVAGAILGGVAWGAYLVAEKRLKIADA